MKKAAVILILAAAGNFLFSFDWPVKKIDSENFIFHFGQKKGKQISTSITVKGKEEPLEVLCAEDGNPLIIMDAATEDTDFFPSALGTSIMLSHNDNFISVYSNLDKSKITDLKYNTKIQRGNTIAQTGQSGIQPEPQSMDFQIIDAKEKKAINPELLLPQNYQIPQLYFSTVTLKNKQGTVYDLQYAKNFPAGLYKIYNRITSANVIYKTTILVNGEIEDQIVYDTVIQSSNMKNTVGAKHYQNELLFPDDRNMLAGEVFLKPGKLILTVQISDIKGNTKQQNYNITVY